MLKKVMKYIPQDGGDYKAMGSLLSELNKCLLKMQVHYPVCYSTISLSARASQEGTSGRDAPS